MVVGQASKSRAQNARWRLRDEKGPRSHLGETSGPGDPRVSPTRASAHVTPDVVLLITPSTRCVCSQHAVRLQAAVLGVPSFLCTQGLRCIGWEKTGHTSRHGTREWVRHAARGSYQATGERGVVLCGITRPLSLASPPKGDRCQGGEETWD